MAVAMDRSLASGLDVAMAESPILSSLPKAAVKELVEGGAIRQYRRGTYLFYQGDDPDTVFFLVKGRVEVSSTSVTGHRQLHTTLDRPQFFGELGVLGEQRRTATAIALEESTVWVVRGSVFLDLQGRVAKRLLQLVSPSLDDLPPDGTVLPAVVTHADLASLCGGSRENVTRILSEFQRRGLVVREGRRYVLTSVSGLSRLAGL